MDFKKEIARLIFKSMKLKADEALIEIPPDPALGDYALPCYPFAKQLKKAPNQIAEEIIRKIRIQKPIVRVDLKGPYVNFFVDKAMLAEQALTAVAGEKEKYGRVSVPAAKKK